MNKNNLIILIITVLLIAVTWYYSQSDLAKEKKKSIDELYTFGTLSAATENISWTTGCMDPDAYNYDPDATTDNNTCFYNIGCCDITATNYDSQADSCNAPNNNSLTCDYGEGGGWTEEEEPDQEEVDTVVEETANLIACDYHCNNWTEFALARCCHCMEQFRDYNTYDYNPPYIPDFNWW
mgnify:FL=1